MPNPLVLQGTLNRLRGSVVVTDSPELNVTASFLSEAGISLSFEGDTVTYTNTMAGAVSSPEPYQLCVVTVGLLKTQSLAQIYEARRQSNALIGDIVVTPDAATLGKYQVTNCSISGVRELVFNGKDVGYAAMLRGYYLINNDLWNG